jgi:hypothetical protein
MKPDYGLLRSAVETSRLQTADDCLAERMESASWDALSNTPLSRTIANLILEGDTPGRIASKAEDMGASPMLTAVILMGARHCVRIVRGDRG